MPQRPNLSVIEASNAQDALTLALSVRANDGVPLMIDPRAPVASELLNVRLPDEAAWAALTSGTTGAPKVVVRSADSWRVAFKPLDTQLGLTPGDGLWMPVHHVSSMALFSAAWAQESRLDLILPTPEDPGVARAVAAHVTPTWLEHLVELLEAGEPSTIRTVLVGGDRVDPALAARAQAVGLRIVSYVGAAELSFIAWDLGDGMRPFPHVAVRIIDGQLWVAGPHIACQVLRGTLRRTNLDGIEWATVGDRVHASDDGALEFCGRSDNAILTAGATVVPADVEAVLNQHPNVTASLVLGQPDALLGQRVVAWVEGSPEVATLRAWVRSRLPKAAQPVQWHTVDRLDRTASGKIRRVVPEVI
ncbi:o-succinylbenzoate--CoA ligase [Enteractinococcus fodinae]|uniref:Acyl-coenzyme A synthetase/AMP-(Fatty) acid ligase n=1 Tax=Enteractinococcus fodinae TaxID=684663 RepID=A0ABU2AXA4_9MICC|nr:AMP-binding protein [Enteractinococcus fodinae]MDR7345972.1 acyl-coenzyme A synthetase/AMP-(fatty) acid ligase [Enteractinococcus fodinae]